MNTDERERVERVERGVAWLDEHAPDWLDKIHLDELNIDSCFQCVLGQVFNAEAKREAPWKSGYTWATERYGLEEVSNRGFAGNLTEAWREKIIALRAERREALVSDEERELVLA